MSNLNDLRDDIHETACEKGWHDEGDSSDRIPGLLCLVHSEVSEVLEDFRKNHGLREIWRDEKGKPCGIPYELADVVIRVLDICGLYDIDIADAVETKMAYNRTRPYRHGGKRA